MTAVTGARVGVDGAMRFLAPARHLDEAAGALVQARSLVGHLPSDRLSDAFIRTTQAVGTHLETASDRIMSAKQAVWHLSLRPPGTIHQLRVPAAAHADIVENLTHAMVMSGNAVDPARYLGNVPDAAQIDAWIGDVRSAAAMVRDKTVLRGGQTSSTGSAVTVTTAAARQFL